MLGINVADAVAIVGVALAVLAAFNGMRAGDAAKKAHPPDPAMAILGATMVDTSTFQAFNVTLRDLTAAIREGIAAREDETEDRIADLLAEISAKLDPQPVQRKRRSKPAPRG